LPQKVLAESKKGIAALHLHQSKANQGDANAQYTLALMYENGTGIPRDPRYAIYWYAKAAQQGHVEAQYRLGTIYRYGYGDEVLLLDFKKAVYWITKAAEQGHLIAQYNLGHMYEWGDAAPLDYKQAFFWYTKAAEKGYVFAEDDREMMLERMSQSQIEEVQKLSKELYEKINNKAK
jgi:hypothetical protein